MTGTDEAQPRTDSSRKEERRRGESAEHRQTGGLNNGWIMVVTCPQSLSPTSASVVQSVCLSVLGALSSPALLLP